MWWAFYRAPSPETQPQTPRVRNPRRAWLGIQCGLLTNGHHRAREEKVRYCTLLLYWGSISTWLYAWLPGSTVVLCLSPVERDHKRAGNGSQVRFVKKHAPAK